MSNSMALRVSRLFSVTVPQRIQRLSAPDLCLSRSSVHHHRLHLPKVVFFSTMPYSPPKRISKQECLEKLKLHATSGHPGWKVVTEAVKKSNEEDENVQQSANMTRDIMKKTFHFVDFQMAWTFMSKVAVVAEERNHHPEWFNVYNVVKVTLTTHDCNGLSMNDVDMANLMDEFESQLLSTSPPDSK